MQLPNSYSLKEQIKDARTNQKFVPDNVGKPLGGEGWPFKRVSHHQVVQEGRIFFPYFIFLINNTLLHSLIKYSYWKTMKNLYKHYKGTLLANLHVKNVKPNKATRGKDYSFLPVNCASVSAIDNDGRRFCKLAYQQTFLHKFKNT